MSRRATALGSYRSAVVTTYPTGPDPSHSSACTDKHSQYASSAAARGRFAAGSTRGGLRPRLRARTRDAAARLKVGHERLTELPVAHLLEGRVERLPGGCCVRTAVASSVVPSPARQPGSRTVYGPLERRRDPPRSGWPSRGPAGQQRRQVVAVPERRLCRSKDGQRRQAEQQPEPHGGVCSSPPPCLRVLHALEADAEDAQPGQDQARLPRQPLGRIWTISCDAALEGRSIPLAMMPEATLQSLTRPLPWYPGEMPFAMETWKPSQVDTGKT